MALFSLPEALVDRNFNIDKNNDYLIKQKYVFKSVNDDESMAIRQ